MKKFFTIIFIFCVAFGMTACSASQLINYSVSGEQYSATNTYTVNLRNEKGEFIAEIPAGSDLYVYGIDEENTERAVVSWDGKIGTVLAGGLVKKETTENVTEYESETTEIETVPSEVTAEETTEESTQEIKSEDGEEEVFEGICINKSSQRISLIINGELICEGDCTTGTKGVYDTPTGVFEIDDMITNTTLTDGETYWADVDYWMPFEGDIGIHDAYRWRSEYGGEIYETDGSHGCINVPVDVAKTIYENSYIGLKVYVFE